jgi:putative oxygen-independent coproporphyrinogen III oxidase
MSELQRVIPIVDVTADLSKEGPAGPRQLTSLPPLSLYIHVPWCVRKCPYCDFNSHESSGSIPEDRYLDALTADLEQALPMIWGRPVHTVFLGGGTPSLLSAKAIDRLLTMIRARLPIWPDAEITIEANPGTAEAAKFQAYADSGVNRISLGIQSFNDKHLQALGRIHDANQARKAAEMAMRAVGRVNLDLMYGLPDQTPQEWCADLKTATLDFTPEHLSLYQLTLEPQTVFAKFPPTLPDEQVIDDMELAIDAAVCSQGWARYEVSAYARKNGVARHNLNYWMFGDYLGIGPGAHSKLSFPDHIAREARTRNPVQWMDRALKQNGTHVSESRHLLDAELPFEFVLNALRLHQGVALSLFQERTGLPTRALLPYIQKASAKRLLADRFGWLQASALGWRHLNDLQALFLSDAP